MYKNIAIKPKVNEAISRKRRQYEPFSPLRDSRILDAKELFILIKVSAQDRYALGQNGSNYPQLVFKTPDRAKQYLEDNEIDDHNVVSVYNQIKFY